MAKLLVIDDEPRIVDFLARALVAHGFSVDRAHGGAEGLARICAEPYDLVVRVTAPPVDGRANRAVCKLVAQRAGVAASRVSVVRGARSRDKLVAVEGVEPEALAAALAGS